MKRHSYEERLELLKEVVIGNPMRGRSLAKWVTSGLGVSKTPNPPQTLCTSAFQACWVRWLGVFCFFSLKAKTVCLRWWFLVSAQHQAAGTADS